MARILKKASFALAVLGLAAAMLFSGWQMALVLLAYREESAVKKEMLAYRPLTVEPGQKSHAGIRAAKALNPRVVGWIAISGTPIDYAFVQTQNNTDYLRRDLHGDYALAGTVFLDYRNAPDLGDDIAILYGHNMKNGGMFGALENYRDAAYMQQNPSGEIYLEDGWFTFTIFACMEADPDDAAIYGLPTENAGIAKLQSYLKENAVVFQPLNWQENHRVLVLSTCADDAGDRRLVVAARLEKQ